jgi:thiamine transporter ThiT
MTITIISFIAGLLIGGTFGLLTGALCCIAGKSDQ